MHALRLLLAALLVPALPAVAPGSAVLTGRAAMGDWTTDAPGVRRRIAVADLPPPNSTPSAHNQPRIVPRPEEAWPRVPEKFAVDEFTCDVDQPRVIVTAPNGDLFVTESKANRMRVLRDADHDGKPEVSSVFTDRLNQPFGIAFYPPGPRPQFVYVANTDAVVRFPYRDGQTESMDEPAEVLALSGGGRLTGGGHWTRDIVFSADGTKLFVSVGSMSNVDDGPAERNRARILEHAPDGSRRRVLATGTRNPVGLAIHPRTGQLWTSVNERDRLGDDLVPDYVTQVHDGGFYGWPWYYLGPQQDPRHPGKHPELRDRVIVPDVLLQSHSASLDLAFYDGAQFPTQYRDDAFAALHGSWNRTRRTGYKVVRIPTRDGKATGEYVDFMTGFVTPEGDVWGRPVGVTTARDGALLVTDDGGSCIWRVTYRG